MSFVKNGHLDCASFKDLTSFNGDLLPMKLKVFSGPCYVVLGKFHYYSAA